MRLLSSPSEEVIEQALWTLGNVMGDNVELRDKVIEAGLIDCMLKINTDTKSPHFRSTFIWVIVNMVRCKNPQISLDKAKNLIPMINKILKRSSTDARIDALWALTYLADCDETYIQIIIDSGIIPQIVPILADYRFKLQLAAMRMLGNIATGTNEQADVLIANDLLVHIRLPLIHPKECLRRMALWCLTNITVGTPNQVQAVFESGLLNRIVENLSREDMKTRREALIALNNMINAAKKEQALDIFNSAAVGPLFHLLTVAEEDMALIARSALRTLFMKANQLVEGYSALYIMRRVPS